MVDVRIVIATFNCEGHLRRCLFSIYRNTKQIKFEVVVIDNGSADSTLKMLEQCFTEVKVVKNMENRGVANARNQGLTDYKARYVLFLDADTVVEPGAIDKMIEFADSNSKIGICGPKLVSPSGELQYTCRRFHNIFTPFLRRLTFLRIVGSSHHLRSFLMMDWDHETPRKVDHVIGACQLVRKEVIDNVGVLNRKMFYGWEDTDYCVRTKKAGFETWYYPYAKIVHHEQRITQNKVFNKLFLENFKSMLIFFYNYPTGILGRY